MQSTVNFFAVAFCLAMGVTQACATPLQDGSAQQNNARNIGRLFEKADANHDGVLTREEAGKTPALSNHFNEMDINQDGKVTRFEMRASIKMKQRHHGLVTE